MTETTAIERKKSDSIGELLEQKKLELASLLPSHVNVDRFIKSALLAVARNNDLKKCSTKSVFTAILNAAELGLDFTPAKRHAYLVPYTMKTGETIAQFMPGYGGLIHLAIQSGVVSKMESRIVYEKDTFSIEYGTSSKITHLPFTDGDPGAIKGAYAVAYFQDGTSQFEYVNRAGLDKVKRSSKAKGGPWATWEEEMHRKTPLKRLCKYLPSSPDDRLYRAIDTDNELTGIVETEVSSDTSRTADLADMIAPQDASFEEVKGEPEPEPGKDPDGLFKSDMK